MNEIYSLDLGNRKTYYKEGYSMNWYGEIDLKNIKEVSRYRNLFIVIEKKKELERLEDMDYVFISTKKQLKEINNYIKNEKLIVILDKLVRLELTRYSSLVMGLSMYKYTVVLLNFKNTTTFGYEVDEEDYIDDLEIYCNIDYKENTISIKEEYKDTFFSDEVLEYIRINNICKFKHIKNSSYDNEYYGKIYSIVCKDKDIRTTINNVMLYLPLILESENNKWYNVKY